MNAKQVHTESTIERKVQFILSRTQCANGRFAPAVHEALLEYIAAKAAVVDDWKPFGENVAAPDPGLDFTASNGVHIQVMCQPENIAAMTFGQAIESLKAGQRVTRAGWNGVGMWLEYRPANGVDLAFIRLIYPVHSRAYPDGARVSWAPSQTDMLADDWAIYQ